MSVASAFLLPSGSLDIRLRSVIWPLTILTIANVNFSGADHQLACYRAAKTAVLTAASDCRCQPGWPNQCQVSGLGLRRCSWVIRDLLRSLERDKAAAVPWHSFVIWHLPIWICISHGMFSTNIHPVVLLIVACISNFSWSNPAFDWQISTFNQTPVLRGDIHHFLKFSLESVHLHIGQVPWISEACSRSLAQAEAMMMASIRRRVKLWFSVMKNLASWIFCKWFSFPLDKRGLTFYEFSSGALTNSCIRIWFGDGFSFRQVMFSMFFAIFSFHCLKTKLFTVTDQAATSCSQAAAGGATSSGGSGSARRADLRGRPPARSLMDLRWI